MDYKTVCNTFWTVLDNDEIRCAYSEKDKRQFYYTTLGGRRALIDCDVDMERVGENGKPPRAEGYAIGDFIYEIDPKSVIEHGIGRISESEKDNYRLSRKLQLEKSLQGIQSLDKEIGTQASLPPTTFDVSQLVDATQLADKPVRVPRPRR